MQKRLEMPKNSSGVDVSVIVPAYNSELFIRECIESIIASTLKTIEIILVDDGSTDKTAAICEEYAQKVECVSVLHQTNQGQNHARLTGLSAAQGNYIGFVDSDDWIDPAMYQILWQKASDLDLDMVCCGCIYEKDGDREIRYNRLDEGVYEKEQIMRDVIPYALACGSDYGCSRIIEPHLCDKLFKRELILHELQKSEKGILWGEDAFVTFRCIVEADKLAVVSWAPYHYRIHNHSISREVDTRALFSFPLLLKCLLTYFNEKQLNPDQIRWYGITAARDMLKIGLNIHSHKFWQFPYEDFEKGSRIILYGAGNLGTCYYHQIKDENYFSEVKWTDSDSEKHKKDKRISDVEMVWKTTYDVVLIAVENKSVADEIKKELLKRNVPKEQIYWKKPEWIADTFSFVCNR